MKKLNLSLWILLIALSLSGCIEDDKRLLEFYLSQPRDTRLTGKWERLLYPSSYFIYHADGYIYHYSDDHINKALTKGDCWYTVGDSILRRFYYTGNYFTKSQEYPPTRYKIEEDYLYISNEKSFETVPSFKRVKE